LPIPEWPLLIERTMSDYESQIDNQQAETDDIFLRLRQRIAGMQRADENAAAPEALAERLANRARVLRGRMGSSTSTGPLITFVAFAHGSQRYGIAISEIVAVQPLIDYTPVPGAPPFTPGVIHWRGSIISLVDLVRLFGIGESGLIDERTVLIVDAAGRRVGILAGEVEELYAVPLQQVKAAPELPTRIPAEWVVGVYDENRLILRIDQILQDDRLAAWRKTTL
jgi:purine-binding chemotaxis protein CheW